jgi:serine/threonine protein kinase
LATPSDAPRRDFLDALADRYTIVRTLGRGGMATVYLANDLRHGRQVALKVLHKDIADSISSARFLREIEIAAGLTHPNILPVHDSGDAAGRLYYVMPFVEGRSLRDLLEEKRVLPIEEALQITFEVADALQYAHSRDIVHRDIKPENILLIEGHPVVSDFGIARAMDEATADRLTDEHIAIGTPAYMSPEQAVAGAPIDGRSDIYSLAVVLFEMIVGGTPGRTYSDARAKRLSLSVLRKRTGADGVPSRVERAIQRALAIEPAERFDSAKEFVGGLRGPRIRTLAMRTVVASSFVAAAGVALLIRYEVRQAKPATPSPAPHRVVVAQFANHTSKPDLDYLGVMAADWVTEGLQRTGIVDVVPSATALQASRFVTSAINRSSALDPVRTLSTETNAGIVITGAYYQQANEVAIQVEVTDALTSKLLGTVGPVRAELGAPISAIEAVRSLVMGLLASKLDERLASSVSGTILPPTFEAYREFSEGLEDYVRNDYRAAVTHFGDAFTRDTTFVSALLMNSISESNIGDYAKADSLLDILAPNRSQLSPYDRNWFDFRRNLMHGDRPAALRAIRAIAATAPGTKATYNLAVEALQDGYLAEAERALESLPPDRGAMRDWAPYWEALTRVLHMRDLQRKEFDAAKKSRIAYPSRLSALRAIVRALAAHGSVRQLQQVLDSAQSLSLDAKGVTYGDLALEGGIELRAHGRPDDARVILEKSAAWYATRAGAKTARSERFALAQTLYELGRSNEAGTIADSLATVDSLNADYLALSGAAAARAHDIPKAARIEAAIGRLPRLYSLGVASFGQARIAAVLGKKDSAVVYLQRAFAEGHEFDLWVHRDVDFALLRGYTPFDELVRPKEP